jgi:hypothetical protein
MNALERSQAEAFRELVKPPRGLGMTPERAREVFRRPARSRRYKNRPPEALAEFAFQRVRKGLLEDGIPEGLTVRQRRAARAVIDSGERFLAGVARAYDYKESGLRALLRRVALKQGTLKR